MADSTSPKGSPSDFTKKIQRQLSRGKEKVLQRFGKSTESRDNEFENCLHNFSDQQTDGNRIHKSLRNYISAVRDMREASKRLADSLFQSYETDWAGEEDLGAIVEGEDLLWADYEVKLLDQAVRTMETYVSQFPDAREKVSKRGRKLVDYDSSRHHLEALQTAKKRDDVKIKKAEEEMGAAKAVYEGINDELKEELPTLFDSRIGCYISVFSAVSNLRNIFYKELGTLNSDLQNVMKELQAQHPDSVFEVKGLQRYGSLRRRTLLSPKAWKSSFSEFHRNHSPRSGSFRSPEKTRHNSLPRDRRSFPPSSQSSILESPDPDTIELETDLEEGASKLPRPSVETASGCAEGESKQVEGGKDGKGEVSEAPAESDQGEDDDSESSSENDKQSDSESLDQKLSAANDSPLHIEESDNSQLDLSNPKENGLENGAVSGLNDLSASTKDASADNAASPDTKTTTV